MTDTWHFRNELVSIRKSEVGSLGNNTYVISCNATQQSVIVDAAADPELVLATAERTNPTTIVTTHGHPDHVGAAIEVSKRLDIPIRLNRLDWEICPIEVNEDLAPGPLLIGQTSVDLVHVPGHTPGSMAIVTSGAVITGDTLFPGGPGATRFPYSDFDQIMDSLDREFFSLPNATVVMPGHGLDTTIGIERPALEEWRSRRW